MANLGESGQRINERIRLWFIGINDLNLGDVFRLWREFGKNDSWAAGGGSGLLDERRFRITGRVVELDVITARTLNHFEVDLNKTVMTPEYIQPVLTVISLCEIVCLIDSRSD